MWRELAEQHQEVQDGFRTARLVLFTLVERLMALVGGDAQERFAQQSFFLRRRRLHSRRLAQHRAGQCIWNYRMARNTRGSSLASSQLFCSVEPQINSVIQVFCRCLLVPSC